MANMQEDLRFIREKLTDIAVDTAVSKTQISHLSEMLPDLLTRVSELESRTHKRDAWRAGASAATGAFIASLIWLITRLGLFGLAASLVFYGCAATPVLPEKPESALHWGEPTTLLISTFLEPDCQLEMERAANFWIGLGAAYFDVQYVPVFDPILGFITVTPGEPDDEDYAGVTLYQIDGDLMRWADIKFKDGFCLPLATKHELGHALGLTDNYRGEGTVMFYALPGQGLGVLPSELEQIR